MLLIPPFFLGRLGDQGMMTHIGLTAASRYCERGRGRRIDTTTAPVLQFQ